MNIQKKKYNVSGIGSALLDFTVNVSDEFLEGLGLKKGDMHLVDEEASRLIFQKISSEHVAVTPGGSSANTLAGVATLGGSGAFIGCIAEDENGVIYENKTIETGVDSFLKRAPGITGSAITFITPDNERTFATHLGAAVKISQEHISDEIISNSSILHLEGYLFENPEIRSACYKAMDIALKNGVRVSIDLSDPSLIGRIKDVFVDVAEKYADIIFVNETEALAFTGKEEHEALSSIHDFCRLAVVKLGEKGSILKFGDKVFEVPAHSVKVVNTNGAGDMYAAGILFGLTNGLETEEAARLASYASAQVVASPGARYEGKIRYEEIK